MNTEGGNATSTGRITPPLKWHVDGGKFYLAKDIVTMMPKHVHYVEPFAGGLSVLFAKDPEGVSEVVNDLNRELTNFWRVLQVPQFFDQFFRIAQATPFSEAEYQWACKQPDRVDDNPPLAAHAFFIRCRQSLAGRMQGFTALSRTRTRSGMNEQASAWIGAVDGLPAVHARLRRVAVLNRNALDVIRGQDGPKTCFYLDPPYLHETRATAGEYAHEMTDEQHRELLRVLEQVEGSFLLSGYRSGLYDKFAALNGWHRTDFELPNNSAGGETKKRMVECVWTNFEPGTDSDLK